MTEQRKDGGPAFPRPISRDGTDARADMFHAQDGMSLRDWFAGQALKIAARNFGRLPDTAPVLAEYCYEIADAMLKAREESND